MKYIIGLGFVAILLGLYAYGSLFSGESEEVVTEDGTVIAGGVTETDAEDGIDLVGTASIETLRLHSDNLECVVSIDSETGMTVEGTLFVAGGLLRGDFMVPNPDLTGLMLSSIIIDAEQVEVWSEFGGESRGVRMALGQQEGLTSGSVSPSETVSYTCSPWEPVDRSVFNAPPEVLFIEMDEAMQAGMEYGTVYEEGAEMP